MTKIRNMVGLPVCVDGGWGAEMESGGSMQRCRAVVLPRAFARDRSGGRSGRAGGASARRVMDAAGPIAERVGVFAGGRSRERAVDSGAAPRCGTALGVPF